MKKIDERQVVVNLTVEQNAAADQTEQKVESSPEGSPMTEKGNRFYVIQKVKTDLQEDAMTSGNQQSLVSSMKGMTTIGNVQTKFNPKPVPFDRANAGVGTQMENEFIQKSVADGTNMNQYEILSDYDEQIKRFETREYS